MISGFTGISLLLAGATRPLPSSSSVSTGVLMCRWLVLAGLLLCLPCHGKRAKTSWQTAASSWYHPRISHVRMWGTRYGVAHRTLKPGTVLEVRGNGRRVQVVVFGWGPARWTGKDLDLTRAVMHRLYPGRGVYPSRGVATVEWRVLRRQKR